MRHIPSTSQVKQPPGKRLVVWFSVLLLAALASQMAADEPISDESASFQLRLEWGGGPPLCWSGLLEVSQGELHNPVSLGVESGDANTIRAEHGAVWIQRHTQHVYDGLDVLVEAPPDADLLITLQSSDRLHIRRQFRVPLNELYSGVRVLPLGSAGPKLSLRRTPGDALRVELNRPNLIYKPHESFDVKVVLNNVASTRHWISGSLEWRLTPARSDTPLDSGRRSVETTQSLRVPTVVPLTIPVPENEGVYDLHLKLTGRGTSDHERSVQFVVLSDQQPPDSTASAPVAGERLVDEFDAVKAGRFRRVGSSGEGAPWPRSVAKWLTISPKATDNQFDTGEPEPKVRWDAYRLKLDHPGHLHRLVVSIARAQSGSLGVSLLEPNAAGQLMPVGIDSAVHLDGISADEPRTHEMLFWPKIRDPILMLHDLGNGSEVKVTGVRVYEIEESERPDTEAAHVGEMPGRLIGPYMHKPYLPENFGATEFLDSPSQRSLDDWVAFLTASRRLVSYLQRERHNGLLLAVAADGSAIYPSRWLEPTPRYDTGIYFSTGQDPVRKDVLELLFRLFDRSGLVLVPELQFSTPLPVLERLLAQAHEESRGIELIGKDGRSWRESHPTAHGSAPCYNPLDPRVQQAVLDVVRELVDRYSQHPSFQGLAVELSSVGYLQLPGLSWGYDDATVERFQQATGTRLPPLESADRFQKRYDFLTTKARGTWVRWRSEELARFYRKLAAVVTDSKPSAQLILAGNRVLRGSYPDDNVYETLTSGGRLEALLAPKGLDFSLLNDVERLTVLRPQLWGSPDRLLGNVSDESINANPALDDAFRAGRTGALLYDLPQSCRIPEFNDVSPWQPAFTWLLPHVFAGELESRKRLVHALAAQDAQVVFQGSWLIPLGEENACLKVRNVIRSIPAVKFHNVPGQTQPLVVRYSRSQGKTYVYAVNDFPHEVRADLVLSCPTATRCRLLGVPASFALNDHETGASVAVLELAPYDVWACELDGDVRVISVHADVPQPAVARLQERILNFQEKLAMAQRNGPDGAQVLVNPGFESNVSNGHTLTGWDMPVQNAALWTLDRADPRSGDSALLLASGGEHAALQSMALPIEGVRLLTMGVWLRSDRADADVRLVFQGDLEGKPRVQSATVHVGQEWRRYVFRVPEIPEGRLDNARIQIELVGPGKLWIDDVDLQFYQLTPDEVRQLTKVLSAIGLAWKEGRYNDCQRMLDGYWGQVLFLKPVPVKPIPDEQADESAAPFRLRKLFRR